MDDWTHQRLAAAVQAYRWMQRRATDGMRVNKAQLYRELSLEHGCTPKAWDQRAGSAGESRPKACEERWAGGNRALIKFLDIGPSTAISEARFTRLEHQREPVNDSSLFLPEDVEDQRERALESIVQRQGQRAFRAALLQAYRSKCEMTGGGVVDVLEAAHIRRYMGKETNIVSNGLLLRADLHGR